MAETNRSRQLQFAYAKRVQKQYIRRLARKNAQLDRRIAELAQADPDMAHGLALLTSIPGIGHQTAVTPLTDMPELGQLGPKGVGSLAGLAPVARDSGLRLLITATSARRIQSESISHATRLLAPVVSQETESNVNGPSIQSHMYLNLDRMQAGQEQKVAHRPPLTAPLETTNHINP